VLRFGVSHSERRTFDPGSEIMNAWDVYGTDPDEAQIRHEMDLLRRS
jgi:hypothetical protein